MNGDRVIYKQPDTDGDVLVTIVHAIAEAEGCKPSDLRLNLSDYTDIDAIERFVEGTTNGYLLVTIGSLLVFVYSTGDVVVQH